MYSKITRGLTSMLISAMIVSFVSCSSQKPRESEGDVIEEVQAEVVAQEIDAVCIYDGISLRQGPSKDSKWLSSISLGEHLTYTGESAIDTLDKDREYLQVILSDGTEGWSSAYGIVENAKGAAVIGEVPIYKRPDLLTVTDKKLSFLDMVAVEETKDKFAKFVGDQRKASGWTESSFLSTNEEDVAVAILAKKQLKKGEDGSYELTSLEDFLNAAPYKNSAIYLSLLEVYNTQRAEAEIAADEAIENEDEGE